MENDSMRIRNGFFSRVTSEKLIGPVTSLLNSSNIGFSTASKIYMVTNDKTIYDFTSVLVLYLAVI